MTCLCLPLGLICYHSLLPTPLQPHSLPCVCPISQTSSCCRAFVCAVLSTWNVILSHLPMTLPHPFNSSFLPHSNSYLLERPSQSTASKKNTPYPHCCPVTICPFILFFFIALNNTSDNTCFLFVTPTRRSAPWGQQLYSVLFYP